MKLLIDCPHCQNEVNIPANMEVACPSCRQPVIAETRLASVPKPSLLHAALHYQGGTVMFVILLVVLIPVVSAVSWFCFPYLPELKNVNHLLQGGPLLFVALMLYFIPALIASSRRASNAGLIFVLNLLAGVTIIGWVAAFIWAAVDKQKAA